MAEITAALVKQLRDKTNAGMMDCKKALAETNGDLEEAVLYLREKGIAKAAAKADRAANQGIIAARISACGCDGILVEVNCETDFVAKNENFQNFVNTVADTLLASDAKDLDSALKVTINGSTMEDFIKAKVIEIGENMMLRKFSRLSVAEGANGAITSYIHMGGKVGVLLSIATGKAETVKEATFQTLIKDITLHIAAAAPRSLSSADLDPSFIEEEQEIAKKRGSTMPYKPSTWDQIPGWAKDPDGRWIMTYTGSLAFIANTEFTDGKCPTSWEEVKSGDYLVSVGNVLGGAASQVAVLSCAIANGGSMDNVQPGIDYFKELAKAGRLDTGDVY